MPEECGTELKFRGLLPGGASTDFIVEEHLDTGHGFCLPGQSRQPHGHWHHDRARRPYLSCRHDLEPDTFFRAGILRLLHALLERAGMGGSHSARRWKRAAASPAISTRLEFQTKMWAPGNTFCALAPGAAEPVQSALKYFREDFERHIREHRCPWS